LLSADSADLQGHDGSANIGERDFDKTLRFRSHCSQCQRFFGLWMEPKRFRAHGSRIEGRIDC